MERGEEVYIPSGDFKIEAGDIISFVTSRTQARAFLQRIGFKTNQVKDCMIIGGGKAAYYLARQLLNMGISVKIIENDRKDARNSAFYCPKRWSSTETGRMRNC